MELQLEALRCWLPLGFHGSRIQGLPGSAEEGMAEARGASGCDKGTAHIPVIATMSYLMRNL